MIYDAVLTDFPRLKGETDDSPRIQRAIDTAEKGVLFIPKGEYEIATMLTDYNGTSIELHPNAVLKAVKEIPRILDFSNKELHKSLNGLGDGYVHGMFIKGGIFDADGLCDCLSVSWVRHFTLSDTVLLNPKKAGLKTGDEPNGYELVATNVYVTCHKPGMAGNIGFEVKIGDSHFTDCIVVDCTIGFDIFGGSSRFTRCHVWGGPVKKSENPEISEYLPNSVAFRVNYASGNEHTLRECYADTAQIGFEIHDKTRLLGCAYLNNPSFNLDDITVIDHRSGWLDVQDGFYRIIGDKGVCYEGSGQNLCWGENYYEKFGERQQPEIKK